MRKLIIICLLLIVSFNTYAGSIDADLLTDDNAWVFIGTVNDYTVIYEEENYPDTEYNLVLTPTKKIKGEVNIGKSIEFTEVRTGKIKLQKNNEYLFGYLRDNLYIWELEKRENLFDWEKDDFKDESIILKERHNDSISQCMQDLLNTGGFERAETERMTLGKQISLTEFLGENIKSADKIRISFNNERFETDKEEFLHLAEEIKITNVKNELIRDAYNENPFENILYIEGLREDDTSYFGAFAAITEYGEVDKYGVFMSRLMCVDYQMKTDDLNKLYSLLPEEIRPEISVSEEKASPNILVYVFAGVSLVVLLIIILYIKEN